MKELVKSQEVKNIVLRKAIDPTQGVEVFGSTWKNGDIVLVGADQNGKDINLALNLQTIDLFVRFPLTVEEAIELANMVDAAVIKTTKGKGITVNG